MDKLGLNEEQRLKAKNLIKKAVICNSDAWNRIYSLAEKKKCFKHTITGEINDLPPKFPKKEEIMNQVNSLPKISKKDLQNYIEGKKTLLDTEKVEELDQLYAKLGLKTQ